MREPVDIYHATRRVKFRQSASKPELYAVREALLRLAKQNRYYYSVAKTEFLNAVGKYVFNDNTGFFDWQDAYEVPEDSEHLRWLEHNWDAERQDLPRSGESRAASNFCAHTELAEDIGFNDSFMYCKKCNEKVT